MKPPSSRRCAGPTAASCRWRSWAAVRTWSSPTRDSTVWSSGSPRAAFGSTLSGGEAEVTAAAGEPWDALVAESVGRGLGGLECLSGIPGLVGATPIQNVGAYGQEVAETIRAVRVLERGTWQTRELSPRGLRVRLPGQQLQARARPASWSWPSPSACAPAPRPPCATGSWPRTWPAPAPAPPTLADARAAVLALRAQEVDAGDRGRSQPAQRRFFFTNPIVEAAEAEAVAARAGDDGAADAALADRRRPGQALGRLAHRAGRHRQGAASRPGRRLQRARAGPGPPRRRHDGRADRARPGDRARRSGRGSASRLVPEPTFVGVAWNLAAG